MLACFALKEIFVLTCTAPVQITEAWAAPGGVYATGAWAASGRVFNTEACASPGGVYTTEAGAAPGLHYLSSRSDIGLEFTKIFVIEKWLPNSPSRGVNKTAYRHNFFKTFK